MRAIILAALVTAPVVQAEIYKCVINGRTTFSQWPCSADAERVEVHPVPASHDERDDRLEGMERELLYQADQRTASEKAGAQAINDARAREYERGKRVAALIRDKRVGADMTAAEVEQAWGKPDHIHHTVNAHGEHERWSYRQGRSTPRHVHFQNGRVTGSR